MYVQLSGVPHISREEMTEVDRLMVEKYKISLIQMMENAGRNLGELAKNIFFKNGIKNKKIAVFAGSGGNGGGSLVAARRLHIKGADVNIFLTKPEEKYSGIPLHQLEIAKNLGIPVEVYNRNRAIISGYHLLVDGLIGYSIKGDPVGVTKDIIEDINKHGGNILSLDIPSGIDPDSGNIFDPHIIADVTMTLALPKNAFSGQNARRFSERIFLADISVPPQLYREHLALEDTEKIFSKSEIVEIIF